MRGYQIRKENEMKACASVKLVLLYLVLVSTLAVTSGASAQPGEFVKGVLQPLADGFPKRALNVIVVDDPGSRDDLYAKSMQAALKGVSPVNIITTCEPSAMGGSWYTLQELLKREGGNDGYYMIVVPPFGMVTDLHVDPALREIGAKVEQLNMVISTEWVPYTMLQRKNAPWGRTYASLEKYGKENPGKLRYVSYEVGSGSDICCEWVLNTRGIKVTKMPQGNAQECASAIGGGMGDFTVIPYQTAVTNWEAGRVDVILTMGATVPSLWKDDPNVVSAKQVGLSPDVGIAPRGFGVPSQVPQAHVDWLYKLFESATTTDIYKERTKTIPGLVIEVVDGKTANAWNLNLLKVTDPIIHAIGIHVDDKK